MLISLLFSITSIYKEKVIKMRLLGLTEKDLVEKKGYHTSKEMVNQKHLWLDGIDIIGECKEEISKFVEEIKSVDKLKIYLVGAGSSAKAASIVENYISRVIGKNVYAIASTDLITQPENYIEEGSTVLLVSFGSSGNTTEGLETVEIFRKKCIRLYQILIICSEEGEIVTKYRHQPDVLYVPIPKGTKELSFAATGEFTLLIQYALMIFDINRFAYYKEMFNQVSKDTAVFFDEDIYKVHALANKKYEVIEALGSNALIALASEMCLKIGELSNGSQSAQFSTILEFRHGPKLFMNSKSLLTFFFSRNEHTKKYEIDMLKECFSNKRNSTIAAISMDYNPEIEDNCDYYFWFNRTGFKYLDDSHQAFQFALFLQSFAILKAIDLSVSPDKPFSDDDGFVNKVAQGVVIYKQ